MISDSAPRHCVYCGLPVPQRFGFRKPPRAVSAYCCSGCRAVASIESAEEADADAARGMLRLGLAIFFTMNVMVFTMALWSQDVYPVEDFSGPLSNALRGIFRWASLIFSLPVLWLLGGPILLESWQALSRRTVTTDQLIALGVAAAFVYSVVSVIRGAGHVYFEVASMVMVFVSIGRWLEAKGKRRTNDSLDGLANLLPMTARRRDASGAFCEVPSCDVQFGDTLRVLAGERFPVDGEIVSGAAHVDEQIVTGESAPVEKRVADHVFSGAINLDGDLQVRAIAQAGRDTISRMIELVHAARRAKGRHELLADRIATWFVPAVCLIAIAAAVWQGATHGADHGILTGLAVVLIACPCALGLATPMAVWTALGRAAERGVLFRSGTVLEKLAAIRIACFDKTGTLTSGAPSLAVLLAADESERRAVIKIAASMSAGSNHFLSNAIVHFANQQPDFEGELATLEVAPVAGKGLRARTADHGEVVLGSRRFMDEHGLRLSNLLASQLADHDSAQFVFVGWGGAVRGTFRFLETARSETPEALNACRALGLELHLLTGDRSERANAFRRDVNIPTRGEQLPEDKVAAIRAFAKRGGVAMVGDGLNDAPALAAADVGVALGCGADVSRETAGVCIVSDDVRSFPWAVGLARMTNRVVKQNLFWAFAYNTIGVGLAVTGRLNPIWAALAMALSSLIVVTNSLRLGRFPDTLPTADASAAIKRMTINESASLSTSQFTVPAP